jgi:hypothetical protein
MGYRVGFDGKWQEKFGDREDALDWAREVGEIGRLVFVVKRGLLGTRLVAVFPEDRAREGRVAWTNRGEPWVGAPPGI